MTKELLTIEFRYNDHVIGKDDYDYRSKKITIGVYDTIEEAVTEGNKKLEVLAEKFEIRDKFKVRGLFGSPDRLITNYCSRKNGIQLFAKITKLNFDDLGETMDEAFKAVDRYKKFKKSLEQE